MSRTVLLVEDNVHIMKINSATLADAGYRVLEAMTLREARRVLKTEKPDSIVLDIMLPDGDGRDFCIELRERYGINVPILFLTALKEKSDMEKGFDAGGTDYLTKPFDLDHLVMKVTAQLKQYDRSKQDEAGFHAGGLHLDYTARRAFINEEDLLLEPKEFALLEILAKNRGHYVAAEELYEKVWKMAAVDVRTVKVRISGLRQKLGTGFDIEASRGEGYRLVKK